MLRVTATRAIAAGEARAVLDRDPAGPEARVEAVNRLFSTLYEALASALEAERRASAAIPEPIAGVGSTAGAAPWQRAVAPVRLSRERALLEGIEFVLETPRFTYRFLNDLAGLASVAEMRDGAIEPREILGAQRTSDGYRLTRKVLSGSRSGFEFTSTRTLAALYLRAGRGTE